MEEYSIQFNNFYCPLTITYDIMHDIRSTFEPWDINYQTKKNSNNTSNNKKVKTAKN